MTVLCASGASCHQDGCLQDTQGHGQGHMGRTSVCWVVVGLASFPACVVSPHLSEDRDPFSVGTLQGGPCWPSGSLPQTGSLYLWPELGLGGGRPVAGG